MDYLNGLGYKWTHYGQELYTNPEFKCSDGYKVRYCPTNWYPQGTTLSAEKIGPDSYIIDSLNHYEGEDEEDYFCWFFVFVDHIGRRIFYQWIKGDIHPHNWILRCGSPDDKNCVADFDHGDQIIPINPLIVRARELASHMRT
jgi:hypothetical protein